MKLDSKSVRDGKMDGGQVLKVIRNTIHDNKKENAALNDVQVEVNYAIKLDDQWTVRPGMLTHFSSNGTRYGPYVKLSGMRQKISILAFAIVTTGKPTDSKTYPAICLVITFIVGMDMSLTILIVISPSPGKLDTQAKDKKWIAPAEFPAGPRDQATSAFIDGNLYVFGGVGKNRDGLTQVFNDVHKYNPETNTGLN